MRVDKLVLKNYRNFESLEAYFGPGVNILIGGNGSGKTNLLTAVRASVETLLSKIPVMQTKLLDRNTDPRIETSTHNSIIIDVKPSVPVEVKSENYKTPVKKEEIVRLHKETKENNQPYENSINFIWTIRLDEAKPNSRTKTSEARDISDYGLNLYNDSSSTLPLLSYYGTNRISRHKLDGEGDTAKELFSRIRGYDDAFKHEKLKSAWKTWYYLSDRTEYSTKVLDPSKRVVNLAIKRCIEDLTGKNLNDFSPSWDAKYFKDLVVSDGEKIIPVKMLSEGFGGVLNLVADMAWRCATLNPVLANEWAKLETDSFAFNGQNGVVMIDEIELNLHPNWQYKIIDLLTTLWPDIQFFITTHSAPVLVGAPKESFSYVINNNDLTFIEQDIRHQDVSDLLVYIMGSEESYPDLVTVYKYLFAKIGALEQQYDEKAATELNELLSQFKKDYPSASHRYNSLESELAFVIYKNTKQDAPL